MSWPFLSKTFKSGFFSTTFVLQRLCDQRLFYERLCLRRVCIRRLLYDVFLRTFMHSTFVPTTRLSYLASIDDFSRQLRPDPNGYLDAVAALVTHCSEDRSMMSQHFLFRPLSSVFLSVCLFESLV